MCESSNNFSDSENSNTGSSFDTYGQMQRLRIDHLDDDTRQFARVNRVILDKNSDEYRKRRERNNLAVKKSRLVIIVF